LPLLAASGDEIVHALKRGGFHVCSQTATHIALEHGYKRVVVRRAQPLQPDELLAILRETGVSYSELVDWLDAPRYESCVRRRTLADETTVRHPRKATK
jgi:predicted RNA binding protein YcfA (HicA-like mRNA interferase family)